MIDGLKNVIDSIRAEEELKSDTLIFLRNEIRQRRRLWSRWVIGKYAAMATLVAAVFLSCAYGYNFYYTPAAYVDMDVNPSIELTLNGINIVIEADYYNDEGAEVLQEVAVCNKPYDRAVQELLANMIDKGDLQEGGLISLTIQAGDTGNEEVMLSTLQSTVSGTLTAHDHSAAADLFAVSEEVRHHAHDYNLSPAKYIAITELQAVDLTATFEGCARHSISQIKELIQAHGSGHHSPPIEEETAPATGYDHQPATENTKQTMGHGKRGGHHRKGHH